MLSDKTTKPIQTYFAECLETPLVMPLRRNQTQRYCWHLCFEYFYGVILTTLQL